MGYDEARIKESCGHMLEAFAYGTPPHGGIAMGIDRLLAIIANEPNIREVIAFPKTGDARDLMMDAPSPLAKGQLDEVGLKLK
jgi:aspartyl-tRNA synthetase